MPVGVGGGKERGGFHLNLRTWHAASCILLQSWHCGLRVAEVASRAMADSEREEWNSRSCSCSCCRCRRRCPFCRRCRRSRGGKREGDVIWTCGHDMLRVGALSWGYVGWSWGYVSPSWGYGRLCWPILRAMLAHLGAMLAHLGAILAHLGGYVGRTWELSWPILRLCWPILRPMLAHVDPSGDPSSEIPPRTPKNVKTPAGWRILGEGRRQGRAPG